MSREIKQYAAGLLDHIGRKMYGMEEVSRLCLTALFTGGHVLLEGNPGLGKTELVKNLSNALRLDFGRIQFTPDLMPADITGTLMPDFSNPQASEPIFKPGPIFTSLLLADEINRATPKTQSAMLEAMAEHQVTVLGEIHKLSDPFMVLATQNPIDHEGTYALPEAQADRFMYKINMPVPDRQTMALILAKTAGKTIGGKTPGEGGTADLPRDAEDSRKKYRYLRQAVLETPPLPSVEQHITNLFLAVNGSFGELVGIEKKRMDLLKRLVEETTAYGFGPRGASALMLGAKAYALLFISDGAEADARALAQVALPILRHRVKPVFDWSDRYQVLFPKNQVEDPFLWDRYLIDLCVLAAPSDNEYHRAFEGAAKRNLGSRA